MNPITELIVGSILAGLAAGTAMAVIGIIYIITEEWVVKRRKRKEAKE